MNTSDKDTRLEELRKSLGDIEVPYEDQTDLSTEWRDTYLSEANIDQIISLFNSLLQDKIRKAVQSTVKEIAKDYEDERREPAPYFITYLLDKKG